SPGVGGQQAPDDALALAAAVDLGGVEERQPRLEGGVPGLADGGFGEGGVVAAHPPGALVAPGPGADPERGDGGRAAGERDEVVGHGRRPYRGLPSGGDAAAGRRVWWNRGTAEPLPPPSAAPVAAALVAGLGPGPVVDGPAGVEGY